MPGLYGGTSAETAKSCSGGKQDGREGCFSARLMWRTDGAGEIYNYYPSGAHTDAYCNIAPMSKCDPKYGDSSKCPHVSTYACRADPLQSDEDHSAGPLDNGPLSLNDSS